jgi:hypothetical protein
VYIPAGLYGYVRIACTHALYILSVLPLTIY